MRKLSAGSRPGGLLIDNLLKAQTGAGVLLGGDVTAYGAFSIDVEGGIAFTDKRVLCPIAYLNNWALPSRDATYTKWGVVYLDTEFTGTHGLYQVWGAPAASPHLPEFDWPNTRYVPLALIELPLTGGAAYTIYDLITPVPIPQAGWRDEFVWNNTGDVWVDTPGSGTIGIYKSTCKYLTSPISAGVAEITTKTSGVADLRWKSTAIWLRTRLRVSTVSAILHFGLSTKDSAPAFGTDDQYVQITNSGNTLYLQNRDGVLGVTTVSAGNILDENMHTYDLVYLNPNSTRKGSYLFVDGIFKARNQSNLPVNSNNFHIAAASQFNSSVMTLYLEFAEVRTAWSL